MGQEHQVKNWVDKSEENISAARILLYHHQKRLSPIIHCSYYSAYCLINGYLKCNRNSYPEYKDHLNKKNSHSVTIEFVFNHLIKLMDKDQFKKTKKIFTLIRALKIKRIKTDYSLHKVNFDECHKAIQDAEKIKSHFTTYIFKLNK